jgi:hypothetical protein
VDVGAPHGGGDAGGEVAVGDETDARAGAADVLDQLLVARTVEDDDGDVADFARKALEVGRRGSRMS